MAALSAARAVWKAANGQKGLIAARGGRRCRATRAPWEAGCGHTCACVLGDAATPRPPQPMGARPGPGVATLSCTDCSASSSSSGTSDITEPCSPYSPASSTHSSSNSESGDDQLQQQRRQQQHPQNQRTWSTASQMAPNVPSEGERERDSGPWSWAGGNAEEEERGPPPPPPPLLAAPAPATTVVHRRSTTSVAASRSPSPSHKRLKVELHHTPLLHGKRCCKAAAVAARQQGKITEYFKTQAKPVNGAKKELVALAAKAGAVTMSRRVTDAREGRKGVLEEASGPVGAACRRVSSSAQKLNSLLGPATTPSCGIPSASPTVDCSGSTVTSPPLETEAPSVADGNSLHLVVSPSGPTSCSKPSLSSPILSVPRTIRFPAAECSKAPTQLDAQDAVVCQWSDCDVQFETSTALLEHLQVSHVNPQTQSQISCEGENYVCLWTSCKVYGRTSCSRSWLERHVLSHGGNKPFRCIVDGCGQRFSSQTTLERHVNSHFNQTESSGSGGSARRTPENVSNKLFRRNGKKLRYRRQPWSARMFDYFDSGIMEGLQHRLLNVTEKITHGNVETAPANAVFLQSKVLARRVELDGKTKVLLRWFPEHIIPDEWVPEADARPSRTVPIPGLPSTSLESLHTVLFSKPNSSRKNRRKQTRTT
ncbi:LOW QUALITY PROTEIN: zinc finger protein aebp2 [Schistocerca americana]|uniref:LOW QUALITY PROTEIN: zinc finger protein aebp2 n=1 Tax=Schistocerca americana TaxID=7009 RepID=UPI001F4F5EC2|nr:LOW QUALITY PROTEIN: zinc finger protein aebp2 [Schistocerca americana]